MRRLSAEERALWRKVVETVSPLDGRALPPVEPATAVATRPTPRPAQKPFVKPAEKIRAPGTTLDGNWDRRLSRGLVAPDRVVDLHGHNLATAWAMIDDRLDAAISAGDRLILLITGKPRAEASGGRGAIRAAVGDWLAASRHAGDIAAVRGAAPRHGGTGALYIILRRRRAPAG